MEELDMVKSSLKNKWAVITGCAKGMGKASLVALAEQGVNILACIRKENPDFTDFIKNVASQHNVEIIPVYFDLEDQDAVKNGAKTIIQAKKPVSILLNDAGITYNALFLMTQMSEMRRVFEVNFFAPIYFSQYIVKIMQRNGGGSIINIASTAGIDGNPGRTAYGGSKAALICATKVMAHELGSANIRVNAIAPGMTDTGMLEGNISAEIIQKEIGYKPIKRLGLPQDIANTVLFLASDRSKYITGQVFRVDGGN